MTPPRSRPLRIVQVSPTYAPLVGGGERMLQAVSEQLVERGHDVTVLTSDIAGVDDFTSSRGAGLPPREILNGVRVRRFNPAGPRIHDWTRWLSRQPGGWRSLTWLFGKELWPLGRPSGFEMMLALSSLDADVITSVNWCFPTSFWACPSRRVQRIPRVAMPLLHIERPWAKNPLYRRMLGNCDAAIVLTDAERDFVQANGARSVAVAGAGVDPRRFAHADGARIRARYGIGDRPVVGFVGRQDTLKGVPTLIESMRTVWQHFPAAVLVLAGQSADRDQAVSDALAGLPEANQRVVCIENFADEDAASIMDAYDVLALPSVEEGFGMVLVEAWMCGKPVIGGDIASTRCVIDTGVDGWTAPPFNSAILADRILDLLSDPQKRAAFGERGRAKVLSRYTWDRVTDVWETTFQNVTATRTG
jgi:glycosyltransferase involved in cell wall biosynthesis